MIEKTITEKTFARDEQEQRKDAKMLQSRMWYSRTWIRATSVVGDDPK